MERDEIMDFLRESLSIEVTMNENFECDSRYVSCNVILRIDGEEISSDYDSAYMSR